MRSGRSGMSRIHPVAVSIENVHQFIFRKAAIAGCVEGWPSGGAFLLMNICIAFGIFSIPSGKAEYV